MLNNGPLRARNIVLMGMPGVGKTTLGRIYAFVTGREFLDFDQFIEKQSGKTIREIFDSEGEAGFRGHERRCLHKIGTKRGLVVAVGGGTLCNSSNIRYARSLGLLVTLSASVETIAKRVMASPGKRPLFTKAKTDTEAQEMVAHLLSLRSPFYNCADVVMETDFSSVDNLILQLFSLEKRGAEILRERLLPDLCLEGLSESDRERILAEHHKFSAEGRPAPALPFDFMGTEEVFAARFPLPRSEREVWSDVVWKDSLNERPRRDDRRDVSHRASQSPIDNPEKKKRRKKKKKKKKKSGMGAPGAQPGGAVAESRQANQPQQRPRPQNHNRPQRTNSQNES